MKKTILIDTRVTSDWSLDLLFAGLVKNLGAENVVDVPAQEKHHQGLPKLVGDPEKDWGAERGSLGYVPEYRQLPKLSPAGVLQLFRSGDVERIFVDEREESFQAYLGIRANLFDVPVIVVAGHDRFWNNSPDYVKKMYGKNFRFMFLDDWEPGYDKLDYAHLQSLSSNFDHLWDPSKRAELLKDKIYDVSFTGYKSHPSRAEIVDHLQNKWSHLKLHLRLERKPDTYSGLIPHAEFFRIIAQSKIALNLSGASTGGRAMRLYEIPYVGSFMLSQKFSALQVHPFSEENNCAYFKDLAELDKKIGYYLKNAVERENIAAAGHDFAMQYHTCEARVRRMLEIIG